MFWISLTALNVFLDSGLKQPILKLMGSSALILITVVNMMLLLSLDHKAVSRQELRIFLLWIKFVAVLRLRAFNLGDDSPLQWFFWTHYNTWIQRELSPQKYSVEELKPLAAPRKRPKNNK